MNKYTQEEIDAAKCHCARKPMTSRDDTPEKLKPCPFCDGNLSPFGDGDWIHDENRCLLAGRLLQAEDIQLWNTRAESAEIARITAQRDRLRKVLREVVHAIEPGGWAGEP